MTPTPKVQKSTSEQSGDSAGNDHFVNVTEVDGRISEEQLERMCNRYYWARQFIEGKDVLEVACGAGQGLGYLAQHARFVAGGDISPQVLAAARATYGDTIETRVFDAAQMPYPDGSFDVVLLFEAIYYLPDIDAFFKEARRVLRPGGEVLIATANKDLFDFVPSPYSVAYYGVQELGAMFDRHGFDTRFWGFIDTSTVSVRQRLLRPVKAAASRLGLMPKTMAGKELLKKLFFGSLVDMPKSILDTPLEYREPTDLTPGEPTTRHKVIYCRARLRDPS